MVGRDLMAKTPNKQASRTQLFPTSGFAQTALRPTYILSLDVAVNKREWCHSFVGIHSLLKKGETAK